MGWLGLSMGALLTIGVQSAAPLAAESAPAPGEIVTRSVGEAIYAEGRTLTIRGIMLAESDNIMGRRFSAGFYPQVKEDARYSWHTFAKSPDASGVGSLSGFKDARLLRAAKDRTQLCVLLPAAALGLKACDTEHRYERIEHKAAAPDGRHVELTYDGKVGTVLRIGYHEQDGSSAISRKDGTLEFDVSRWPILSYRDVRIEVLSADGGQIRYRVMSPPTPGTLKP